MRSKLQVVVPLLAFALPGAPSHSLASSEVEFSEALNGCWARKSWPEEIQKLLEDPDYMLKSGVCFEGGQSGTAVFSFCEGKEIFDCWTEDLSFDAIGTKLVMTQQLSQKTISCDAQVVPGRDLRLYNCTGDFPAEVIYERAEN